MLKKFCAYPGCNNKIDISKSYCQKHSAMYENSEARRQYEYDKSIRLKRDKKYHSFYVSNEWKRMKKYINNRYKGLCLWSYYHGIIVPFDEIHHIEPIKTAWGKRLYIENLIPLTHQVHMQVEAEYKKGNNAIKRELYALISKWNEEFKGEG